MELAAVCAFLLRCCPLKDDVYWCYRVADVRMEATEACAISPSPPTLHANLIDAKWVPRPLHPRQIITGNPTADGVQRAKVVPSSRRPQPACICCVC
jgi:hypothetical protein